ncbi:unnamed protein product [Musa acuminata subsp. burmannicoides]
MKGGLKENEGNACALTATAIAATVAISSCPTHEASCLPIQDWYPCQEHHLAGA